MRLFGLLIAAALLLPARVAAGPEVVVSIAPVHSLVARVMQGAGAPYLLLPPGRSPHDYALRPSDAAALERAALVFWVDPVLERWLERPLATLAAGAHVVRLSATPGLTRLAWRSGEAFEVHDHGDGHGEVAAGAGSELDPHLWLDPENAKVWVDAIAAALAVADPDNAALYHANATAAHAELDALEARIDTRLAPVRGRPFIVFHDAYRYFERRFGIPAAGAVALDDARPPGPARLARIRDHIRTTGAHCLFREPQFHSPLIETVAEGTGARIGVLDPLGSELEPGPALYPAMLAALADGLARCLN
jgi:zinc transport system substrate-binding protein